MRALAHGGESGLVLGGVYLAALAGIALFLILFPAIMSILNWAVLALVARASGMKLRFLIEWMIRSLLLAYGSLGALLAGFFWPGLGIAWKVIDSAGSQSGEAYILSPITVGLRISTHSLWLIPAAQLALTVAFFLRRRAYS